MPEYDFPRLLRTLAECNRAAIVEGIYIRSLKVAFVVGTILNIIQQLPWEEARIFLTFLVPFLVATYGAIMRGPVGAKDG